MRIKSILNYKKPTFWAIFAAVVVCISVGVAFMINPISLEAFYDDKEAEPVEHGRYQDFSGENLFNYNDKDTGIVYTIMLNGDDHSFAITADSGEWQGIYGTWELFRNVLYLYSRDSDNKEITYIFNKVNGWELIFDKDKSPYAPPLTENADELFEKAVFVQTDIKWIEY